MILSTLTHQNKVCCSF